MELFLLACRFLLIFHLVTGLTCWRHSLKKATLPPWYFQYIMSLDDCLETWSDWLAFLFKIALLLDIAKAEVHSESSRSSNTTLNGEVQTLECDKHSPMSSSVLELVELILKPPKGGSPCLQENVEAVFFFNSCHKEVTWKPILPCCDYV